MSMLQQEVFLNGFPAVITVFKEPANDEHREFIVVRVTVKVKDRTYAAQQLLDSFAFSLAKDQQSVIQHTIDYVVQTVDLAIQVGEKPQ